MGLLRGARRHPDCPAAGAQDRRDLRWETANDGSTQRVEALDAYGPTSAWAPVGSRYVGDGTGKSRTQDVSGLVSSRFYRVRVEPAP